METSELFKQIQEKVHQHMTDSQENDCDSQLRQIKAKLHTIACLDENWDGYDAVVPSEQTIRNSFSFVETAFKEGFTQLDPEDVYPTLYGSVVLDFETEQTGLVSVEIGKEQIGFFTDFKNKPNYALDATQSDFTEIPPTLKKVLEFLRKDKS